MGKEMIYEDPGAKALVPNFRNGGGGGMAHRFRWTRLTCHGSRLTSAGRPSGAAGGRRGGGRSGRPGRAAAPAGPGSRGPGRLAAAAPRGSSGPRWPPAGFFVASGAQVSIQKSSFCHFDVLFCQIWIFLTNSDHFSRFFFNPLPSPGRGRILLWMPAQQQAHPEGGGHPAGSNP